MLFNKLLNVLCVAGCILGYSSEKNMESSPLSLNSIEREEMVVGIKEKRANPQRRSMPVK